MIGRDATCAYTFHVKMSYLVRGANKDMKLLFGLKIEA